MIISVRTRYHYDSYQDLYKLFDLAGFPWCYVDQVDISKPVVYILSPMNGEWRPHLNNQAGKQVNAHLILWNLERPSGSSGSVGKYGENNRRLVYGFNEDGSRADVRYCDEVWFSDRRLAQEVGDNHSLRYVPLGSHPKFGKPGEIVEKRYIFTHQSYENPRRQTIYKDFSKKDIGPNCWGGERDRVLKESKLGVATHQDGHPFIEPLRLAIFAAYGLPTICETSFDSYPYGDTLTFATYDNFVETIKRLNDEPYEDLMKKGQQMRELMTDEFEFGKQVRLAVEQSVGDWR